MTGSLIDSYQSFLNTLRARSQHRVVLLAAMIVLFLMAFALPVLFAVRLGGVLTSDGEESAEPDKLFPQALRIGGPNSYLAISDSESLEPKKDADFLVAVWVRVRRLPADGERMLLFSKYDPESRSRRGYAVALSRDGEVLRPEVYWRDDSENGTWFTFSDIIMPARAWTMFALSFRKQRILGLHAATLVEHLPPKLQILGGYELDHFIVPDSESPLVVGSFGQSRFRGNVGPIGIFSQVNLSEHLNEVVHNLAVFPTKVPPQFEPEEVKLWTLDGKSDRSNYHHEVRAVRGSSDDVSDDDAE